ncbi:MAG: DEAD/DEAH box helicase family protein, partial [Phaeodactylibacter sp.]|nr:DEAD/DEAH box helicase family protein [Phaeodactylibacter sp.]
MGIPNYSEADTRVKFIDPQLYDSGWREEHIVREYYFTDGRKLPGGKRGKQLYLDYLLTYNNLKVAILEAKRYREDATKGLQQAIDYAVKLGIEYVYASNGRQIYEFIVSKGKGQYIGQYPNPAELFQNLAPPANNLKSRLLSAPFHTAEGMRPRYYQERAVNSVMEAIANRRQRILLTLATGTGKTYIAFQIVYKLITSKWNVDGTERRPRILFLADRNILADQAINTFNPFEKDLLKIDGSEIRKRNGRVPTNAYIFFAIYQAIAERENIEGYYKEYPSDFFDLVIIDECHRGSANEEGSWRDILDHFSGAVHLGLTATPKRKDNIDTYGYFGNPVYEYSLKEGINDGFLTPYKVKRIKTNIDEYIYTSADTIVQGQVEKPFYTIPDFNRDIVIPERAELIAKATLQHIRPLDKTIIFCVDQAHALLMRDMINKHKEVRDPFYCVRITSDEGKVGRELLEKFQDNDKDIPTI